MKTITKPAIAILIISAFIYLSSCEEVEIPAGNDADFTHFEFVSMLADANIDRESKTIYAEIDSIEDLSNLIPTFVLTQGATAYINNIVQQSGSTANDFSKIVEYKIISENKNTTNYWTIVISKQQVPHEGDKNPTFDSNVTIPAGTYKLDGIITISSNVYFNIQPGVTLVLSPNSKFIIEQGAQFIARGTETKPIIFKSETNENWDGFVFNNVDEAEFHFCTIQDAGQPSSQLMEINNSIIGIMNSTFQDINSSGFLLDNTSMFRTFDNNVFSNVETNTDYPIIFNSINGASNLGDNNIINTARGILIKDGTIKNNITLVGQTCPYIIETDITCNVSDITFFIRNGATIEMNKYKGIFAGNSNMVFKAEGTATKPIKFKGMEEVSGCWEGISINGNILPTSNLTFCEIYYGGNGGNSGAIKCNKTDTTKLSIQNCVIKYPNSHGIYFTKDSDAKGTNSGNNTNNSFEGIPSSYKDIYRE